MVLEAALAIMTLVADIPKDKEEPKVFPAGKTRNLKKVEKWNVYCMDMDLHVKRIIIKTGEKKVDFGSMATVTCNNLDGKPKAYFTCPEDSEADGDPPEVMCK